MIQFNELYIDRHDLELRIDVSVQSLSIYDNVYLDKIIIDNQDTYVEEGPSHSPLLTINISNPSNDSEEELNVKSFKVNVSKDQLPLHNQLLFVYVLTKGNPDFNTPCDLDNSVTLGVVCNLYHIFIKFMHYVREVEKICSLPKRFIDSILRFKALNLALSTGNYLLAIKYWNKYFKNKTVEDFIIQRCCHEKP